MTNYNFIFQISMNTEQLYVFSILRSRVIVAFDEAYSRFLIQDFDPERKTVKVHIV